MPTTRSMTAPKTPASDVGKTCGRSRSVRDATPDGTSLSWRLMSTASRFARSKRVGLFSDSDASIERDVSSTNHTSVSCRDCAPLLTESTGCDAANPSSSADRDDAPDQQPRWDAAGWASPSAKRTTSARRSPSSRNTIGMNAPTARRNASGVRKSMLISTPSRVAKAAHRRLVAGQPPARRLEAPRLVLEPPEHDLEVVHRVLVRAVEPDRLREVRGGSVERLDAPLLLLPRGDRRRERAEQIDQLRAALDIRLRLRGGAQEHLRVDARRLELRMLERGLARVRREERLHRVAVAEVVADAEQPLDRVAGQERRGFQRSAAPGDVPKRTSSSATALVPPLHVERGEQERARPRPRRRERERRATRLMPPSSAPRPARPTTRSPRAGKDEPAEQRERRRVRAEERRVGERAILRGELRRRDDVLLADDPLEVGEVLSFASSGTTRSSIPFD